MQYIYRWLVVPVVLFGFQSNLWAGSATLSWDANTESDLAGYKVYMGASSGNYPTVYDVGNVTTYTVGNLVSGTFYFVVTAYDSDKNVSPYSK